MREPVAGSLRRSVEIAHGLPGTIAICLAETVTGVTILALLWRERLKIHDLELFPSPTAAGQSELVAPTRSLLVRLTTASGLEGWGESSLGWRIGELAARREALLAVLAGRSVFDIEELHTLEALSPAPLRSAVEMAVWDLLGRVLRQPLCNLLGGYYRRRVPVSVRLARLPLRKPSPTSRANWPNRVFTRRPSPASGRPDEDVKNLAAIREMLGDRVELRLDGLGRFDMEAARDLCAGLEFEDLQFFLDPLNAPELHAMAVAGPADERAAGRLAGDPRRRPTC